MARVAINTGAAANDGTGDTLRAAGGVINNNFLEVYTYLGAGSTTTLSAPVWSTTSVGINTLRNVGIGTTNPRFALEVGAVGASGTTLFVNGDARITGILTIGTSSITLNGSTNIINVGTGVTINGSTGIISATSIVLGGATLTGAGVTRIEAGSGISVDQNTGQVTITATGGGGTGAGTTWVATNAGIHTTKNVGIGTTNPTSALTVKGTSALENVTVSGVSTFTGAVSCASTVSFGTTAYFGVSDEIVLNDKFKVYTDASNTYLKNFDTNTGGDLYIQSDVILIQKYDGSETIAQFTEGAGVQLNYQGSSRLTTIEDGVIVGSNTAGVAHIPNELRVGTVASNQSNASILIANSSGVGIGTTNPGEKLQVDGNIRVGISTTSNYITFRGTHYDGPANTGGELTYQHTYIGERIYDYSGTGERSELLIFKGNDIADGVSGPDRIRLFAGEHRFDVLGFNTTGTFEQVGVSTAAINKLTITSIGVGIGTTNPTSALTVVGSGTSTSQLFVSGVSTVGVVTGATYFGDASRIVSGKWTLGENGTSDYTFTGIGFTQTTNDPALYLARGAVYEFVNNMGAHPFRIQSTPNGSAGTEYNNGVTNNNVSNGTLRFEIPFNAPNTLYYQCTSHSGMGGTITIYPSV